MDHTATALVPRTIRLALLFHSYSNLSQLDPGFLLSLYCMRLFPSLVWGISSKPSLFKVHAASLLCARVHRKLPRLCAQVPPQIISKTNFHIINILAMIWKHIYIVQICIIHCTNMYQKKTNVVHVVFFKSCYLIEDFAIQGIQACGTREEQRALSIPRHQSGTSLTGDEISYKLIKSAAWEVMK